MRQDVDCTVISSGGQCGEGQPIKKNMVKLERDWHGRVVRSIETPDEMAVRFWSHVKKTETCWIWQGSRFGKKKEYGEFLNKGKRLCAHRVAWELTNGPIPEGLTIDHLCRVQLCVNPGPDHMETVTNKVNILRGTGPAAVNARKTHCKRGHKFDEENTTVVIRKRPGSLRSRRCKECHRTWRQRKTEKQNRTAQEM